MSAMSFANRVAYRVLVIACLAVAVLGTPTYAASFDCAKAQTRVEKFVCNDPFISKLDSQLGKVYDKDIAKANPEQKARLIAEQRHWMSFTRAACKTQTCFKHAYWSRLAELETFFIPYTERYKSDASIVAAIKKAMTTKDYSSLGFNSPACGDVYDVLDTMKDVHIVDPTIRAMSYEDSALDSLRRRAARECKKNMPNGAPITFTYKCQPSDTPPIDWSMKKDGLGVCQVYYALPPFQVYTIPPIKRGGKKRYVFFSEAQFGPMNIQGYAPDMQQGNTAGSFLLFPDCGRAGISAGTQRGGVNTVIEYKHRYYILTLGIDFLSISPLAGHGPRSNCVWSSVHVH